MSVISLDKLWYARHPLRWLLLPFAWFYQCITFVRRYYLTRFDQQHFSVPIVVVGNISVGGVGKTPFVIGLVQQLQARGLRVGIVSRGYGATVTDFPHEVLVSESAKRVGDEPLLLAKRARCPVVIAPDRVQAVRFLVNNYQTQVIVSDDGLQHYKMGRAIEIAIVDGVRGLGNGLCLPAGPLRESPKRLQQVDFIVVNGGEWPGAYRMDLSPGEVRQLISEKTIPVAQLPAPVAAVAAIGHPERFFSTLRALGVNFNPYPFPDHYSFQAKDLDLSEKLILMTEKDAVKCQDFATEKMYYLPVDAIVDGTFWDALYRALNSIA